MLSGSFGCAGPEGVLDCEDFGGLFCFDRCRVLAEERKFSKASRKRISYLLAKSQCFLFQTFDSKISQKLRVEVLDYGSSKFMAPLFS